MTQLTPTKDEQIFEDDVHCRIADCRRRRAQARRARARSQRSTLRAQNLPPIQKLDEPSFAQARDQLEEREEALIT
jgi:hypothetical protein